MNNICVFLINYTKPTVFYKALSSLKKFTSQIESIIVLQEGDTSAFEPNPNHLFINLTVRTFHRQQMGQTINDIISNIDSEYVLFLYDSEYLSSTIDRKTFQLKEPTLVLGHTKHHRNISLKLPLLVQRELLKKHPLLLDHQLPYQEALLPIWLTTIDQSLITFKDSLVKQARENSSRDLTEKRKLLGKYQFKKETSRLPSLSILIANYNMDQYIETAIASCLNQNECPDQIYMIDDGSTDNSYKQMQHWEKHSSIHLFTKENEGKAKALNKLLTHVTTDFILELDADDWLDPDAIFLIKNYLAHLPKDVALLYGNFRRWKQRNGKVLFKNIATGRPVNGKSDLLTYRFPLGPRIYRTTSLKTIGGFPVISFENGRLYEDISVLNRLIRKYAFQYENFTVYNVREHQESITRNNLKHWQRFFKTLE